MFTNSEHPLSWQRAWLVGIAPQLSVPALESLASALERDSSRLIQGATTSPPPLQCLSECPLEGACGLAYAGWKGDGLETVAEVEGFFSRLCVEADRLLGEPAAVAYFLNWFDDTPREQMRRDLLAEVRRELDKREYANRRTVLPFMAAAALGGVAKPAQQATTPLARLLQKSIKFEASKAAAELWQEGEIVG